MTPIRTSKLCPHIQAPTPDTWRWWDALSVPPVAVKFFSGGDCLRAKQTHPGVITVKRHYVENQDQYMTPDGGRRFVDEQQDLSGTEFLEFLNETLINADTIRRCNDATLSFVTACIARGVKPLGCSIPVGNPATMEDIGLYAPAAQAILDAGGALQYHSYHARDWNYDWMWLAGRYEQLEGILRAHGVTGEIRWMLSESGHDGVNCAIPSGAWKWLVHTGVTTIEHVQQNYHDYAQRLDMYPGVVAAFVYTFWREHGTGQAMQRAGDGWRNFSGLNKRWRPVEMNARSIAAMAEMLDMTTNDDPWRWHEHADSPEMLAWFSDHWQQWQGGQTMQTATVNTWAGLKVRTSPNPNAAIIGAWVDGTVIHYLTRANGWVKVPITAGMADVVPSASAVNSGFGYASDAYLDFQ